MTTMIKTMKILSYTFHWGSDVHVNPLFTCYVVGKPESLKSMQFVK